MFIINCQIKISEEQGSNRVFDGKNSSSLFFFFWLLVSTIQRSVYRYLIGKQTRQCLIGIVLLDV